jgi:hypothetical protein
MVSLGLSYEERPGLTKNLVALSHIALQSQIIALQGILLTTFLYGPTSPDPVSQQLSKLDVASRAAGVASVDILAAQQQRQQATQQQAPRSTHPSAARSVHSQGTYRMDPYDTNTVSSALVTYEKPSWARSGSPVNTTVLDRHTGIQSTGSHIDNSSFASTTSYGTEVASPGLYCPYAKDLDRYRSQPLSSSITSGATPHCPQCKRTLHLSPGRAWEVYKNSDGCERRFQVSNRFAVKCHRPGPDAGYACILCSRSGSSEAICGDVKALIQHVWQDHKVSELKAEEDITEVIDLPIGRRRDSVPGYSTSRSSGRSASLGSRRRRSRYDVEHEVEAFDVRHSRRAA